MAISTRILQKQKQDQQYIPTLPQLYADRQSGLATKGIYNFRPNVTTLASRKNLYDQRVTNIDKSQRTISNHLELFPKWAIKKTSIKPSSIVNSVYSRESQAMNNLQDLGVVTWSQTSNSWKGDIVANQLASRTKKYNSLARNLQISSKIAGVKLSDKQIEIQLPVMVRQILQANKKFSALGVGPVKNGGFDLYAGRYVNENTGRIDTLPKASLKMVDQTNYNQVLAYKQARVLNKWNQYVRQSQNLAQFMIKQPQKYQKAKFDQIAIGLNKGTENQTIKSKISFYMKIGKMIVLYAIRGFPANSPYPDVIDQFNIQLQKQGNSIADYLKGVKWASQNQDTVQDYLDNAANAIETVQNTLVNRVAGQVLSTFQKYQKQKKYINACQNLNFTSAKRIKAPLKNAIKAITGGLIPTQRQNTSEYINALTNKFKQIDIVTFQNQRNDIDTSKIQQTLSKVQTSIQNKTLQDTQFNAAIKAYKAASLSYPTFNRKVFKNKPVTYEQLPADSPIYSNPVNFYRKQGYVLNPVRGRKYKRRQQQPLPLERIQQQFDQNVSRQQPPQQSQIQQTINAVTSQLPQPNQQQQLPAPAPVAQLRRNRQGQRQLSSFQQKKVEFLKDFKNFFQRAQPAFVGFFATKLSQTQLTMYQSNITGSIPTKQQIITGFSQILMERATKVVKQLQNRRDKLDKILGFVEQNSTQIALTTSQSRVVTGAYQQIDNLIQKTKFLIDYGRKMATMFTTLAPAIINQLGKSISQLSYKQFVQQRIKALAKVQPFAKSGVKFWDMGIGGGGQQGGRTNALMGSLSKRDQDTMSVGPRQMFGSLDVARDAPRFAS